MAQVGMLTRPSAESASPQAGAAAGLSWRDSRILPFGAYMAFIAVASAVGWLGEQGIVSGTFQHQLELWLYPAKTLVVTGLLISFWSQYEELQDGFFSNRAHLGMAIAVGALVYVAWVRMDWPWATQGALTGYDPTQGGSAASFLICIRLFGAAIVVPVMEELFWRSFLLRYIDASHYLTVRIGLCSAKAAVITIILFGLEHQLWLAGMMAGAAYTIVLVRTQRLWPCILAHGVTNLLLGIHVMLTGEWKWW